MESIFLLHIALILLFVKVFGIITNKFHMPQIIGAILAGIFLGPAVLGIITETEIIKALSEMGIIVLMFFAGIQTNIDNFKKSFNTFFIIAVCGMITPFVLGSAITNIYFNEIGVAIFVGLVLTTASVSIMIESLTELKKIGTKVGQIIVGAGVFDDILGIILLSFLLGEFSMQSKQLDETLFNITAFFLIALILGYIGYMILKYIERKNEKKRRIPILALVFAVLLAFIGEALGVGGITGAYIAGVIVGRTIQKEYISSKINTMIYMLFGPIVFSSIGLKIMNINLSSDLILFGVIILIIAAISKFLGCYFGARLCKVDKNDSLKVGIGMMSRGEVAVIMLDKGLDLNLITNELFTVMIIIIIITTLSTQAFLEIIFKNEEVATEEI